MLRPMTSHVSALSSIVANGHQAIHSVSSAPSKIPYGEFSPVRLQTRCRAATFTGASAPAYRPLQPASGVPPLLLPGYLDLRPIRARRTPSQALPSSGPWLRQRFCCPPASSLTMATSELLRRSHRFHIYSRWASPDAAGPHFYLPELNDVPPSVLRWFRGPPTNPGPSAWPSPFYQRLGNHSSTHRSTGGTFTKLQRSLNAAARHFACPTPDGTFTTELACVGSLQTQVGYDYKSVRLALDRTLTGRSGSLVGCTVKPGKTKCQHTSNCAEALRCQVEVRPSARGSDMVVVSYPHIQVLITARTQWHLPFQSRH